MHPTEKTIWRGKASPINPYRRVERAVPPIVADENSPRIAPLFFSGRARIIEDEKIVFPAQLRNDPRNIKMHIGINALQEKQMSQAITDNKNPIDQIQYLALGLNLNIPSKTTQTREPTVLEDIKNPYCSTLKPFSRVNGSIREKTPATRRLRMMAQGMKILRHGSEKMV